MLTDACALLAAVLPSESDGNLPAAVRMTAVVPHASERWRNIARVCAVVFAGKGHALNLFARLKRVCVIRLHAHASGAAFGVRA